MAVLTVPEAAAREAGATSSTAAATATTGSQATLDLQMTDLQRHACANVTVCLLFVLNDEMNDANIDDKRLMRTRTERERETLHHCLHTQ